MLGMLAWNAVDLFRPRETPPIPLSYSAFLDEARAGNVASVTITGQNVEGDFNQPTARVPEAGLTQAPFGGGIVATPTAATPTSYTRFTTMLPPFPDDRLLPLLEEQGVP